jgi:hypothetical protein
MLQSNCKRNYKRIEFVEKALIFVLKSYPTKAPLTLMRRFKLRTTIFLFLNNNMRLEKKSEKELMEWSESAS